MNPIAKSNHDLTTNENQNNLIVKALDNHYKAGEVDNVLFKEKCIASDILRIHEKIQSKILKHYNDTVKKQNAEEQNSKLKQYEDFFTFKYSNVAKGKNLFQLYRDSRKIEDKINPLDKISKEDFDKIFSSHSSLHSKEKNKQEGINLFLSDKFYELLSNSNYQSKDTVKKNVLYILKNLDKSYSVNAYLRAIRFLATDYTQQITLPIIIQRAKQEALEGLQTALSDLKIFYLD
jgi:hypothetical protein